jgi:tetratricopeptide (TPR) repeat protein
MHLDAAMLAANSGPLNGGRTVGSARPRQRAILTTDGGYSGVDVVSEHWDWGRQLIDLTMPQPNEDRWALLWYVASSSFMANRSLLADLQPHLAQARKLFPTDPDILFASGCYFDMIASPRVRPMLEAQALPFGLHVDAPSERESLRTAEDYFRRAADARPAFVAARVRRGRALAGLGRYDDALRELRAVGALDLDPATKYLVTLFEAEAQEAMGSLPAAQALYEEAARQFPQAQSPYLALSRLARDRGDRAAALAAAEHVFTRRTGDELADPWWTYYLFVIRDASAQLHALQQTYVTAAAPAAKD